MCTLAEASESLDADSTPTCDVDANLLKTSSFDNVSEFLRSLVAAVVRGRAPEEAQSFCIERLQLATTCCPIGVALSISNLLRTAEHTARNSKVAVAIVCRTWCQAKGVELVVRALVCGNTQVPPEAELSCVQFLCNFQDLASSFAKGFEGDQSQEWLDSYPSELVAALFDTWFENYQCHAGHGRGAELCTRLCLRGNSSKIAARLCFICLENAESEEGQGFGGVVLCAVAEENAGAVCNLVDDILQACGALLYVTNDELACISIVALHLLPRLLSSIVGSGTAIHHSLTDRLWRRSLGGQLSAAVVFSIVDFLKMQPDWPEVRFRWCQVWAEDSILTHADLNAQKALALRLVRMLACTVEGEDRDDIFGGCMRLLLKGVHIRLGAQVNESRWYGMAVAEAMAKSWPSAGGDTPALHFEGFDLLACGLGEFRHASDRFKVTGVSCKVDYSAARFLYDLLLLDKPKRVAAEEAAALSRRDSCANVEFEANNSERRAVDALVSLDREADSDDDDDPLSNMPPLSPLHCTDDNCADLLLIQPPRYLRSAYEMLLGPAKEGGQDLSSPELPTAARARVRAALAELPTLVKADVPEIRSLAEPLCARLLHVGDAIGLEEMSTQRKAALVSLLIARGSRALVVRFLIAQFGADDLMLTTRVLILNVLTDAAKQLSNGGLSASEIAAIKRERPQIDPPITDDGKKPKTRRFASATRIPTTQTNHFAAELRAWFFPLLARWRRPDAGNARPASGDPILIGNLLQCFGVMLECAGRACPDRDATAEKSLDLVEEFWSHGEPQVRRCCSFLLSRVLLVGSDALVMDRPLLLDRIELAILHESDETCRKMVAGIMAWVEQRSLC